MESWRELMCSSTPTTHHHLGFLSSSILCAELTPNKHFTVMRNRGNQKARKNAESREELRRGDGLGARELGEMPISGN